MQKDIVNLLKMLGYEPYNRDLKVYYRKLLFDEVEIFISIEIESYVKNKYNEELFLDVLIYDPHYGEVIYKLYKDYPEIANMYEPKPEVDFWYKDYDVEEKRFYENIILHGGDILGRTPSEDIKTSRFGFFRIDEFFSLVELISKGKYKALFELTYMGCLKRFFGLYGFNWQYLYLALKAHLDDRQILDFFNKSYFLAWDRKVSGRILENDIVNLIKSLLFKN